MATRVHLFSPLPTTKHISYIEVPDLYRQHRDFGMNNTSELYKMAVQDP